MAYWASLDPDSWWFAGFLVGLCLAYALLVYSGFRQLELFPFDQPITTTITETGLHFSSPLVVSDVPWASIRAARETKDGLVLTSRFTRRPVLLPSAVVSKELTAFVVGKVRQHSAGSKDGA
jgi:hypothetical protein